MLFKEMEIYLDVPGTLIEGWTRSYDDCWLVITVNEGSV